MLLIMPGTLRVERLFAGLEVQRLHPWNSIGSGCCTPGTGNAGMGER